MPTPLEILLDPLSLIVIGIYLTFMVWERVRPARELPRVRFWWALGLGSFAIYFYASSYLPLLWDAHLAEHRLFDLTSWDTLPATIAAVLVYEFFVYCWHRTMHRTNGLWRSFHQMHHSAERLDTLGAFFFSPMDMIGWTFLGSLALALVVGLSPHAATATLLITTTLGIFQHTNVRTPRWLGYLVQRPESHSVHHQRGVHAKNYSDLPVFDILFGTFDNPSTFADETGFYDGASTCVIDMLLMKDVSKPPYSEARHSHDTLVTAN